VAQGEVRRLQVARVTEGEIQSLTGAGTAATWRGGTPQAVRGTADLGLRQRVANFLTLVK
jgi:hypothetical protein